MLYFCFPCLLVKKFIKPGMINLNHLNERMKIHDFTVKRINNTLNSAVLRKTNNLFMLDSGYRRSIYIIFNIYCN